MHGREFAFERKEMVLNNDNCLSLPTDTSSWVNNSYTNSAHLFCISYTKKNPITSIPPKSDILLAIYAIGFTKFICCLRNSHCWAVFWVWLTARTATGWTAALAHSFRTNQAPQVCSVCDRKKNFDTLIRFQVYMRNVLKICNTVDH